MLLRILHSIPKGIRFLLCGGASNVIFLLGLNFVTSLFHHQYTSTAIYSAFSLLYIPVGHALSCALVFGWPKPYLPSLISTSPIGLSCTAIGTLLTGFLDKVQFDRAITRYLELLPFLWPLKKSDELDDHDESKVYSSIVVLIVTGIFAYYASDFLMSPKADASAKKKE